MTLATFNNIKTFIKSSGNTIKLIPDSTLLDNEWCNFYKTNNKSIDSIPYKMFGSYVFDDVENPLKTQDTTTLIEELTLNATMFLKTNETYLNRLWEIESLNFSPIENYDRYEDIKDIRSGNETTELSKTGTESETNTTNGSVENAIKNNQKETIKNEPTSYNTNLIDTSTTEYSGNADTNTTSYNNLITTNQTEFTDRKDKTTHDYNNITDAHNAHIHGNIGVTTSTAMMTEYINFYTTYNFWLKFWNMYIKFNCRADFNTESED